MLGEVLPPNKMVSNKIGVAEENCWDGTGKKICAETHRLLYAGGVQKKPIFIHVDITEDLVKLVAWKLSGSSGPAGTDSESLQGWILKLWEDSKNLCISVEMFVDWISNNNPPSESYCAFISVRLVTLDKQTSVCPVSIVETWRRLLSKCVLKVKGTKSNKACQDDQHCARLK